MPNPSEEELQLFQETFREVVAKIRAHPSSWPFLKPVDRREVPDYYEVIKDPIGMWNLDYKSDQRADLDTVSRRVEAGNYYITKEIFLSDLRRMCDNCKIYNHQETEYYKCSVDIENEFLKKTSRHFRRLETESAYIKQDPME